MVDQALVLQTAAALRHAQRILVITGAGLSADSGLPTYRGVGGLYNGKTDDGLPIEVALSGPMLRRDPELCWKYIASWQALPGPASRTLRTTQLPSCNASNPSAGC